MQIISYHFATTTTKNTRNKKNVLHPRLKFMIFDVFNLRAVLSVVGNKFYQVHTHEVRLNRSFYIQTHPKQSIVPVS